MGIKAGKADLWGDKLKKFQGGEKMRHISWYGLKRDLNNNSKMLKKKITGKEIFGRQGDFV